MSAKVLVVDDNPLNVKMLADILAFNGYQVVRASGGQEALAQVEAEKPDIVLLDVMMSDLDGYSVCTAIRANPDTAMLPVVMVTALDPREERVKGVEAGADDFLSKPVNQHELLARVRSLLRIKAYHDQVQAQARELQEWSLTLERRVEEGVLQVEKLSRMKRFLSPQVAELVVGAGASLKSHRAEITVVFLDIRGFTAFTETADPEEVLQVLREYHAEMGRLIMAYQGTLAGFSGDGIMIFFNDPLPLDNPAGHAACMCIEMHARFAQLAQAWRKRGHDLGMGIGIAQGFATLGVIGFEGRQDYGAIGSVCNLASRLCSEARNGQILVSQKVMGRIENLVQAQPAGDLRLKGFHKPVPAFNVTGLDLGGTVKTSGATAE
jgi:adenylate cyclase